MNYEVNKTYDALKRVATLEMVDPRTAAGNEMMEYLAYQNGRIALAKQLLLDLFNEVV